MKTLSTLTGAKFKIENQKESQKQKDQQKNNPCLIPLLSPQGYKP